MEGRRRSPANFFKRVPRSMSKDASALRSGRIKRERIVTPPRSSSTICKCLTVGVRVVASAAWVIVEAIQAQILHILKINPPRRRETSTTTFRSDAVRRQGRRGPVGTGAGGRRPWRREKNNRGLIA